MAKSTKINQKFLDDVFDAVVDFFHDVLNAALDAVAYIAKALAKIGFTIADFINAITDIVSSIASKVLPDEVARLVVLLTHFIDTAAYYPPSLLQGIANGIANRDIRQIVDAFSPAAAAAIRTVLPQVRAASKATPIEILNLLPTSDPSVFAYVADRVRYALLDDLDDSGFIAVWRHFKGKREAICLDNCIVFVKPPDFSDATSQFLYIHEITHALQYKDLGIETFVHKYGLAEIDRLANDNVNSLEREADEFACSILPDGHPYYIGSCPI